jgi:formylglycine-generating enzyme required for sulfatase activity
MKDTVSVGLFKKVMEGYKISGHKALELEKILLDPSRTEEEVTYVSLLDAREFAKRLSDLTGRKFRVPTKAEWLLSTRKAEEIHRSFDTHVWTETKSNNGEFILGHMWGSGFLFRDHEYREVSAEERYNGHAIRLVEDLPGQGRPAGKFPGYLRGFFSGLIRPTSR